MKNLFYNFFLYAIIASLIESCSIFNTSTIPKKAYLTDEKLINAIELTNCILDSITIFDIVFNDSIKNELNSNQIPIIETFGARDPMIFVPKGYAEIHINRAALSSYLAEYSAKDKKKLNVYPEYLLCLLLLHEVGHINYHDYGLFFDDSSTLNTQMTLAKEMELRADRFAANCIKKKIDNYGPCMLDASMISMSISSMSWNLSMNRIVYHWSDITNSKMYDQSYSHPNLELRFLVLANEFTNSVDSVDSNDLIEDFLKRRQENPLDTLFIKGKH
ncbi:hypothetical protein [Chondrinema litorale]|uniref:hypothetical protein n=1 Tax=Chondrinema litorale TaxID=2994555 RepID=UPI002542AA49|nr:hypothetical protein [Chondrinema litorale]UZS00084.1 hypothetical protein OQ292_39785 [Chondrinema litorale]